MNIITGYKGTPHVTAQQDRDINSAIFTNGVYILNIGSKMAATIVSANEVTIADGLVIAQGCVAEIARGTSESLTIDNGTQGQLRKDLIVLRYTRNASTNIESMELDIIKGTPASSNPSAPSYTSGAIADGDTTVEFPLYEILINGITIQSVTLLATRKELASKSVVDGLVSKIGTGTLATTAQNIIAAVNELRTSIVNAVSRIGAVETKTAGIVRTNTYSVSAGATDYKQLAQVATYMLIINTAYPSDTMKGVYLVGMAGNNTIGVKTVSNATDVIVSDGGNGLLRVKNNGGATLRCTLITTYA